MESPLSKLVVLYDVEEYITWLIWRQEIGIWIISTTNIIQFVVFLYLSIHDQLRGGVIMIIMASCSIVVTAITETITLLGYEEIKYWAEPSWYMQMINVSTTILTGITALFLTWLLGTGSLEGNRHLLGYIAGGIGVLGGAVGCIFLLATLGIYNVVTYGTSDYFYGYDI